MMSAANFISLFLEQKQTSTVYWVEKIIKTLQHSVSSSSVYMCVLYFLLVCFVFLHLINVCIESLRNMHLNFVNHVILICKQDLHLRTDVLCLGIGITIILCIITKYSIATYRITCIFLLLSHFANYFVNTIS